MIKLEIAGQIATRSAPAAVRAENQAAGMELSLPLDQGLELQTALYERTLHTKDRIEGLRAFKGKRTPAYRGE